VHGSGKWFDELRVGETFGRTLTITDSHLLTGAGYVGDWNPLHMDENFARASRFGGRILHGMLTSALMGGPVGTYFHGTAIAYLEHNARFLAPVRPGDTLDIGWTITELEAKPRHGGGIAVLAGTATNQDGIVTTTAQGKIMVFARAADGASAPGGATAKDGPAPRHTRRRAPGPGR
jgi:3-hydroxybutyryl-CoA dehydratase